jgi:hypothetical protein
MKYVEDKKLQNFNFILNTSDSNKKDDQLEHWIAIYCDSA